MPRLDTEAGSSTQQEFRRRSSIDRERPGERMDGITKPKCSVDGA